ncbi:uncharacterized protein TNCV_1424831 [Trichonephila clavipes]|nr:uncharacterized protein TNCV_1424831 [Trichonephila clavipes]
MGSNPGESMDVCKCIVPSRHKSTSNSYRATSPLVRLVEGEERWEVPDHLLDVLQNWGGIEQNRTFNCMVLKATANDRLLRRVSPKDGNRQANVAKTALYNPCQRDARPKRAGGKAWRSSAFGRPSLTSSPEFGPAGVEEKKQTPGSQRSSVTKLQIVRELLS